MQDEHESGEGGVGMLAYADTHGKCRESKSKEDPGVFGLQPRDRVYGGRARGDLRLGRAGAGSAGVWEAEEEGTGGLIRAYEGKVTGLSESQLTRLIRSYLDNGRVEAKPYRRHKFPAHYTAADIRLQTDVDPVHLSLLSAGNTVSNTDQALILIALAIVGRKLNYDQFGPILSC